MALPADLNPLLMALRAAPEVEGLLELGSRDPAVRDAYSDHDLLVVTSDELDGDRVRALALGAGLSDDDSTSRHRPLDRGGFVTADDVCVELSAQTCERLRAGLDAVLAAEALDEGLVHQLARATVIFDRGGAAHGLAQRAATASYPDALLPRLLATKPGTALKLLRTAVHRDDTPRAAYWLARTFEDSVRALFAMNGRWYPGPKRMLMGGLDALPWCPASFVPWWRAVLERRRDPWPLVLEGVERVTEELLRGPQGPELTPH